MATTKMGKRSTSVNDLNDEMLSEILIRLSRKEAFQCKSVCKRWSHLITDPYFIASFISYKCQTQQRPQERLVYTHYEHLYLTPPQQDDLKVSLDFLPRYEPEFDDYERLANLYKRKIPSTIYIVGSCSGLFLCLNNVKRVFMSRTPPPPLSPCYTGYICNPCTKQWASIPPPPHIPCHVGFICEPYYYIDEQGHVSINSNFRFKVVVIPEYNNNEISTSDFHVDVFSSEAGKWSELIASSRHEFKLSYYDWCFSALVYKKKMHWLTPENKILVYDPYNNNVECLDGPQEAIPSPVRSNIGVCRNSLWMSQFRGQNLKIWRYDKMKWSLKKELNLDRFVCYVNEESLTILITIHPDDPDILYLNINFRVISFNSRTNTWQSLGFFIFDYHLHNVVPLVVPFWPTPIPPLSYHVSSAAN